MLTFVAQTYPREERDAARRMEAQGVSSWTPELDGALILPGYLFLRHTAIPWAANGTQGVIRLLPFADRPIPVPDDQMEAMREIERAAEEWRQRNSPLHEPRGAPTIAGMARTMVANLLRTAGFSVTVQLDRVVQIAPVDADPRGRHRRKRGLRWTAGAVAVSC